MNLFARVEDQRLSFFSLNFSSKHLQLKKYLHVTIGQVGVQAPEASPPGLSKTTLFSPSYQSQQQPLKFHAKFTRRFIELDDELISIVTDIEDDDPGAFISPATGYHTALPLEVHGSGYQPMAMISNSKAGKLSGHCLKVSIDYLMSSLDRSHYYVPELLSSLVCHR